MNVFMRLLGSIWVATLVIMVGFTLFQIDEQQQQLTHELESRATLVGEGLKEAIEPVVARGATTGIERMLKKFGRPYRGIAVYDKGVPCAFDASAVRAVFEKPEIAIAVDLGLGDATARAWGTDLSAEYVRINADYTS